MITFSKVTLVLVSFYILSLVIIIVAYDFSIQSNWAELIVYSWMNYLLHTFYTNKTMFFPGFELPKEKKQGRLIVAILCVALIMMFLGRIVITGK